MPKLFRTMVVALATGGLAAPVAGDGPPAAYQRTRHAAGVAHGNHAHPPATKVPHRGGSGYQRQHRASVHARPNVSGGFFQRPYPYHLDYYRMRWGGSYAPYFGNLYGPPNVVLAPPYYAPPYGGYGGFGWGGFGYGGAAPPPGMHPGYHNGYPMEPPTTSPPAAEDEDAESDE